MPVKVLRLGRERRGERVRGPRQRDEAGREDIWTTKNGSRMNGLGKMERRKKVFEKKEE